MNCIVSVGVGVGSKGVGVWFGHLVYLGHQVLIWHGIGNLFVGMCIL